MMITSAICWGSWANTYKGVKNYRFELFLLGLRHRHFPDLAHPRRSPWEAPGHDASSFLNNVRSADTGNIVFTMVGRRHL